MALIYADRVISSSVTIRHEYALPPGSTAQVSIGQRVRALDPLAVNDLSTRYRLINLAEALHAPPEIARDLMRRLEGDMVEKGDEIAARTRFLGRTRVLAPVSGRIAEVTGPYVLIEAEQAHTEVSSPAPGRIIDLDIQSYVSMEMSGTILELAWASGRSVWGTLKVLDTAPSEEANASRITIDHRGSIIVVGSPLTADLIEAGSRAAIKGLIGSSISHRLLPLPDDLTFPVAVTQGFGALPMSPALLPLLAAHDGRDIALNLGIGPHWREKRPEIIIPVESSPPPFQPRNRLAVFSVGDRVRVLQEPWIGGIGTIRHIPGQAYQLQSGLWASGALVETAPRETVFVPFENMEYLG
ncbi:MAG: hypothetical protein IT326_03510 [Anaerolineae bacterium]|nr:hypothetical protein [Anaerolineae bacterium]